MDQVEYFKTEWMKSLRLTLTAPRRRNVVLYSLRPIVILILRNTTEYPAK